MYFDPPLHVMEGLYSGELHYTMTEPFVITEESIVTFYHFLTDVFQTLIDDITTEVDIEGDDLVRVVVYTDHTHLEKSHATGLMELDELEPSHIIDMIAIDLHSNDSLELEDMLIVVFWSRAMGGGKYYIHHSIDDLIHNKKCIVKITGELCFFQCLILCIESEKYSSYIKKKSTLINRARKLFHHCPKNITLPSLDKYAQEFNVRIIVLSANENFNFIKRCEPVGYTKTLVLLYVINNKEGHFHYVNPDHVNALWDKSNFCWQCYVPFHGKYHSCVSVCKCCKSPNCPGANLSVKQLKVMCVNCRFYGFDDACVARHSKLSICKTQMICPNCDMIFIKAQKHRCGYRLCYNCKDYVDVSDGEHLCYFQPYESKNDKKDHVMYYDYETYIDEKTNQQVALVVVIDEYDKIYTFSDNNSFIEWLFQKKHKNYTFIAHNAGKFDFHFIKKEMLERNMKSTIVANGNKIYYCRYSKLSIRFIDSLMFIPLPLRIFPKTFGFKDVFKGYFPYKFLTKDTLDYIGPFPELSFFEFHRMKSPEYEAAMKWYENNKMKEFNMREILLEYCIDDVRVLKKGCEIFRKNILDVSEGKIDPWKFITIAGTCMNLFKAMDVKHDPMDDENSIAILKDETMLIEAQNWGYYYIDTYFKYTKLSDWRFDLDNLTWIYEGHEYLDKKYLVFKSCIDTGCLKCFKPSTQHPTKLVPMSILYYAFEEYLSTISNKYILTRQCDWMKFKKDNHIQDHCRSFLRIRDAFFGGRTEVFSLFEDVKDTGDKIEYVDFTSLYPSVYSGRYIDDKGLIVKMYFPTGHPDHVDIKSLDLDYSDQESIFYTIDDSLGFIKCCISSPDDIDIPILPIKLNGKLLFPQMKRTVGTWTTLEVLKAMTLGYIVHEIYDILNFEVYSSDVFLPYVTRFMKLKIEAGTWSKTTCKTEEEKEEFCRIYKLVWNIEVDRQKMEGEYNAGMYYLSKLMLNSFWGKFGQKGDHCNSVDTFNHTDFMKYCHSDQYDVTGIYLHNNCARTVTYKEKDSEEKNARNTNVAIAAFVTAHARIRLYSCLQKLGKKALYCDTDSVIYRHSGEPILKIGSYLGELTSELASDDYIIQYCSTGCKSYAYKTLKGKSECKCKGFRLNKANSEKINYHSMLSLFVDETKEIITEDIEFKIMKNHVIQTRTAKKVFKFTFDKRKIDEFTLDDSIDHLHTTPHVVEENKLIT